MKVLGIEVSASDIQWVILEGNKDGGKAEYLELHKQGLPISEPEEAGNLLRLRDIVSNQIKARAVQKVSVIKATEGCSPLRCKIECMIQCAAKDAGVTCQLVASQTIASEQKRIETKTGKTLEQMFFNSKEIAPKYLVKAAFCAWSVLRDVT